MYATKRRKDWRTWPGFQLNRRALTQARILFNNRRSDLNNLSRLVAPDRITYIRPGIDVSQFLRNPQGRARLRRHWGVGNTPVILTAAMFRSDVKSEGLAWVIETCHQLQIRNRPFYLVLVGDGPQEERLRSLARALIPGRHRFVGRIHRGELHQYYSAADIFVFPGIGESLGMVYLEAQACGLPVVAFDNGGIAEVVRPGLTGILTPFKDRQAYLQAVERLLCDPHTRSTMGTAATAYVHKKHDLRHNYRELEAALQQIVLARGSN
jgi:glycosyltransferase involved in cell wall biosynthesis